MRKQPVSKGFGAGLQIWLLFLLSLYWADYSALFSIAIGAIGGFVSGFIVDWWQGKEERTELARRTAPEEGIEEVTQQRQRQRQRRNSALRQRKRQREPQQRFNWREVLRRNRDDDA